MIIKKQKYVRNAGGNFHQIDTNFIKVLVLGFAEVIYLLQSIKSRVHIVAENTSSTAIVSKENTTNNISDELPDL